MKRNWIEICLGIFLILGISYGLGYFIDFWRAFAIVAPTFFVIIFAYVTLLKDVLIEKKEISDELVKSYDQLILEQQEVIQEYEKILDTQYISIECDCKKGVFEGFFDKNGETVVTCDECKQNYKIIPKIDVFLVSEPLNLDNNQIFDKIKKEEMIKD